jgi:hypothetical protein
MMKLLQPAREDGVSGSGRSREGGGGSGSREECGAAFSLDPLTDLRPVEVVQVALASAACRVDGRHLLESVLDEFLAQQFAEGFENDAVADAEEEVERGGHDALGWDGEERTLLWVERVTVRWSAMTRGGEEAFVRDDADRARMSGRGGHETEDSIDERPVAIEKGTARVDEMLQHGPDVREGSGVTSKGSQALCTTVLQLQPAVSSLVHEQWSKVLLVWILLLHLAIG